MVIAIGDRVSTAADGPALTVVRILDDGTLECLGQIAGTGASGEISRHRPDTLRGLDGEAMPDGGAPPRAETEPSGANLPDGQSHNAAPDTAAIAARAYALWEAAGRPDGQHEAHWLQAEQDLGAPPPRVEPAIEAGAFISATGRMTPTEAYDENPKTLPENRAGAGDAEIRDEP